MSKYIVCTFAAASIESQSSMTDQIGSLRLGKLDMAPGPQGTSTPTSGQSSVSAELCTHSQGGYEIYSVSTGFNYSECCIL